MQDIDTPDQESKDVIGEIRKHTKTGGRKPGTPNKKALEVREIIEELGVNPIEILAHFMMNDYEALGYKETQTMVTKSGSEVQVLTISPELRASCAKEIASYVYAKRRAIEVTGKDGEPLTQPSKKLTPEDLIDIVRKARSSELKSSDKQ